MARMTYMARRRALLLTGAMLVAPTLGRGESATRIEVYKSPSCGCCGAWADHLARAGFAVVRHDVDDLDPMKARAGVPEALQACHTAFVAGYAIEGHVPAVAIQRLLRERPAAAGLAVPGMPIGSPGMESGSRREPYIVWLFDGTKPPARFMAFN